jgi:BASS family bile acid:Na+ symporter
MFDIINSVLLVSVMVLLLGVGLSIPFSKVIAVATQYQLVLRGLAVNFVIVPFVLAFALQYVPLSPDLVIGLLILAAVPLAPLAPPFVAIAQGDVAYSVGLMLVVAFLALPLTPLVLAITLPSSEAGLEIDPLEIFRMLLTAQLIPLTIGLMINHFRPVSAEQMLRFVPRLGRVGVLCTLTLIAANQGEQIVEIGIIAYSVVLGTIVVCLLIGHVMMIDQGAALRRSLAVSTAIRNAALALLIVNTNYPNSPAVTIVFMFGLISLLVAFSYGRLTRDSARPH